MGDSNAKRAASVLFVEDDAPVRQAFARRVRSAGHIVRCAATIEEGRHALSENEVDVAFVDVSRCDGTGIALVRWALSNHRAHLVYCMSGSPVCGEADASLKAGCKSVFLKPVDIDGLVALLDVQNDEQERAIAQELDSDHDRQRAKETLRSVEDFDAWRALYASCIIGDDEGLLSEMRTLFRVSDTDCSVLITGESGTGKELFARALHDGSSRTDGPFIALNCAALPETMIEAELFGHARGAFTGAHANRRGRVAAAEGGTLFLDEVGDMPLSAQAKLLRMLQDHTIMPVGADTPLQVDLRVIAATNQDLEAMVADGRFRLDLFFRLKVIPIDLPPLRERNQDIITLANHFLEQANLRNRRQVIGLDGSARRALLAHQWPGNVRELGQLMERAVLLEGSGTITAAALGLGRPKPARTAPKPHVNERRTAFQNANNLDLRAAIEQVEREVIDEALERTGGNRTEAAALLGVNRTTLVEKLRKRNSS